MMSLAIATHMAAAGVKTVGFIGFADAYGEGWFREFSKVAPSSRGCTIVANERYARTDTSVTGQVLKLVVGQARRGADRRLGHAGRAAADEPSRSAATPASTTRRTASPTTTSCASAARTSKAPTCRPARCWWRRSCRRATRCKRVALDYVAKYEAANGKGSVSTFGAHAWDAGLLMAAAAPVALKKAQPGTPEFRAALRDALEKVKELHGAHGVFNMSPTDHLGLDQRARVMVKIENGAWKYQP